MLMALPNLDGSYTGTIYMESNVLRPALHHQLSNILGLYRVKAIPLRLSQRIVLCVRNSAVGCTSMPCRWLVVWHHFLTR